MGQKKSDIQIDRTKNQTKKKPDIKKERTLNIGHLNRSEKNLIKKSHIQIDRTKKIGQKIGHSNRRDK